MIAGYWELSSWDAEEWQAGPSCQPLGRLWGTCEGSGDLPRLVASFWYERISSVVAFIDCNTNNFVIEVIRGNAIFMKSLVWGGCFPLSTWESERERTSEWVRAWYRWVMPYHWIVDPKTVALLLQFCWLSSPHRAQGGWVIAVHNSTDTEPDPPCSLLGHYNDPLHQCNALNLLVPAHCEVMSMSPCGVPVTYPDLQLSLCDLHQNSVPQDQHFKL